MNSDTKDVFQMDLQLFQLAVLCPPQFLVVVLDEFDVLLLVVGNFH